MSLVKSIKKLCSPAYIYFVISTILLALIVIQNLGNTSEYCIGNYSCEGNTIGILIGHAIYIAFWTFILNMLCKHGYSNISWFLLFLPFILGFILIGILVLELNLIKNM